jgi:transcriptional regulator with XRE-family HTH domain
MPNVDVKNFLRDAARRQAANSLRSLRDLLIEERQRRHLSQQTLADAIGMSRSAISDFERMPERSGTIIAFAYAFAVGLEIQLLFERQEGLMAESALLEDIPEWEETA